VAAADGRCIMAVRTPAQVSKLERDGVKMPMRVVVVVRISTFLWQADWP
jgi:hypothetical protein